MMFNLKHFFRRKRPKMPTQNSLPPESKPYQHISSSQLGIPPAIYMIVYEMDLFDSSSSPTMFLSTSCQLALYEHQGIAIAAPVDRRRDEEFKMWYLRRIREVVYFNKPLSKLTSADVHAVFFPEDQNTIEEEKDILGTLFERRPALFYESSLENILGDTYRRKNDYLKTVQ